MAATFLWSFPGYLRRPLTSELARATVRQRLARREADFLELVDRAIYANPASPYRQLLARVRCERGDLDRLVRQDGVEGALAELYRQGVYLTVDEFKGRQVIRRGRDTIPFDPDHIRSPGSAVAVPTQTGGTGGAPRPLIYDLDAIRDQAMNTLLALDARGGGAWIKAVWGMSSGSAPVVIRFGSFGRPVARWFMHVSPAAAGIDARYRWVPRTLAAAAWVARVRFPHPEVVSIADPLPIARWMAVVLRAREVPHLYGFGGMAVLRVRRPSGSGRPR